MTSSSTSTIASYAPAFFGLRASRLTELIVEQGARYTKAEGIRTPVRGMSTLLCLRQGPATVTELAAELGVTHAAVIKNARMLESEGFIDRGEDPSDARQRPLSLTAAGRKAAEETAAFMELARQVYLEIFDEIGIDVHAGLVGMEAALARSPLDERLKKCAGTE